MKKDNRVGNEMKVATTEQFRPYFVLLNNLYEIERKLTKHEDPENIGRNLERMKQALNEHFKLFYEDPLGQEFKETRTDLEASISGSSTQNLVVTDVIKPIIRWGLPALSEVVQRGVVIVEGAANE